MENEVFMRFLGGREKALTLSYDDGVFADKRLIALLNRYNLKCTFNLNSGIFGNMAHGRMPREETIKTFSNCGHEIAAHGSRHLFLTKVDKMRGIYDVISDKKELENIFGSVVCGFAYPYGAFSEEIKDYLKLVGIKYARTTNSTGLFEIPDDFLELNPTCHHEDPRLTGMTDRFLNTYPHDFVKEREPYLFYVWGHSYEFDEKDNWHIIEKFAEKVSGFNDVWYATNGEIYRYVTAYNSLEFSVDAERVYNPSALDVWFEKEKKIFCAKAGQTTICK